jgi:hypothetical protein
MPSTIALIPIVATIAALISMRVYKGLILKGIFLILAIDNIALAVTLW